VTFKVRLSDRICCNPKCLQTFHPIKRAQKYCTHRCAEAVREKVYPAKTLSRLAEMHKAGMSYKDIGRALDLSKDVVAKLCNKEGLTKHVGRPPKTWTPEEITRLGQLLSSGMSYREVANVMGKSYSAVWSRSLNLGADVKIDPPLCCPVCDHQMNITSRRRFGPWNRGQEKLLLKLVGFRMPQSAIGAVFNVSDAGVQRKLKQIRERSK
jgi:transposase